MTPTTLDIFADTRSHGRCPRCRHPLTWATRVDTGRRVPLDADAVALTTRKAPDWRLIESVDVADVHTCP